MWAIQNYETMPILFYTGCHEAQSQIWRSNTLMVSCLPGPVLGSENARVNKTQNSPWNVTMCSYGLGVDVYLSSGFWFSFIRISYAILSSLFLILFSFFIILLWSALNKQNYIKFFLACAENHRVCTQQVYNIICWICKFPGHSIGYCSWMPTYFLTGQDPEINH